MFNFLRSHDKRNNQNDSIKKKAEGAHQKIDKQDELPALPAEQQNDADGGALLYTRLQSLSKPATKTSVESSSKSQPSLDYKTQEATGDGSSSMQSIKVGMRRLMKEMKRIQSSEYLTKRVFSVELEGDNLYEWNVKLYKFDDESMLAQDLRTFQRTSGIDNIWLRFKFPDRFPFEPPFVRVLAPYVQGGFVLSGGAICLELLTPDGWSQAYSLEAVIVQLMTTIAKGGARIVKHPKLPWNETTAKNSYKYLVERHKKYGWYTPPKEEAHVIVFNYSYHQPQHNPAHAQKSIHPFGHGITAVCSSCSHSKDNMVAEIH
eukprot:gene3522-6140_t